jgi:hypothetical protein
MEARMADVNVGRDVNGSFIVTGHGNLLVRIDHVELPEHSEPWLSSITAYLEKYFDTLYDDWQRLQLEQNVGSAPEEIGQSVPRASAYLWRRLASGEKELKTAIYATSNGNTVELKEPDIKLRVAQQELVSQRGQPANASSQTGEELIKNLISLVNDDLDESTRNRLVLNLGLPDLDAERLIRLDIAYSRRTYSLKAGLQTLAGEPIRTSTNITIFYKTGSRREVCRYTMRHGEMVQIPEIEPGHYHLQIMSRETQQLLWRIDLELGAVLDRLM